MMFKTRYAALLLAAIFLALAGRSLLAQTDLSGLVMGRVLTASLTPLAQAEVSVVVRRGHSDLVVARAQSDADGRYQLAVGALTETPYLRVQSPGWAARQFELKPLGQGQGLLVPDLNLDRGRIVTVEVIEESLTKGADLELLAMPLDEGIEVIDLDGPALATASFKGARAELALADRDYALVIRDRQGLLAPELLVWRVGPGSSWLPPVALSPGAALVTEIKAPGKTEYHAKIVFGSGVWHPEGGAEYRLQITQEGALEPDGATTLSWSGLGAAIAEIEVYSAELCARMQAMPGDVARSLSLGLGAQVKGRVTVVGSGERVANARVQVGDQLVATDADGRYEIHGLLPGTHAVHVQRQNFIGGHQGFVSFDHFGTERQLDLALELGAEVSGVARDDNLQPLPQAIIGCEARAGMGLGLGRYMFTTSNDAGEFQFGGVSAGTSRLSILNAKAGISVDDLVDIEKNARVVARPRLGQAAFGHGKIETPAGDPARGAYLYFVSAPAPLSMRYGAHLENRDDEVFVRKLAVDAEGRYSFQGLPAGAYDRVLVLPDESPELLPRLRLEVGVNDIGMDWQALPQTITTLDLPEDVVLALKSESGLIADLWLYRPPGEPPLVLNLPLGRYRVEMLRGGISRFGPDDEPYREQPTPQVLAQFSSDSLETVVVAAPDAVVFAPIDLHFQVNGSPPAERRLELTVYALAGSWPLKPMRIATGLGQQQMELQLPRGLYLIHGRQAELAEAWAGPITVGTGFSELGRSELVLDLQPTNLVFGRVAPEVQEILGNRVMKVRIESIKATLIRPFRSTAASTEVAVDGDFQLPAVATGTSRLIVQADELRLVRELNIEPFQTTDLGELIPEAEDQPQFHFDQRALFGAQLRDERHQRGIGPVVQPQIQGTFSLQLDLEGERGEQALRVTRLSTSDGGAEVLNRAVILGAGRSALRLKLSLDGQSLKHWPVTLRPIQADGYDFERAGIDFVTDEEGRIAADALPSGAQALRFGYSDERGQSYQLALGVTLADSTLPRREHIDVVTSPLKITARDLRDGRAIAGAQVSVKRTDLRGVEHATVFRRDIALVTTGRTDLDGELRLESLPLGTYDIEVSYPGMLTQHLPGFSLDEKGPLRVVQLQLGLGRRAELRFTDQAGRPATGLRVFLFAASGFPVHDDRMLMSNADGRLELAVVPEGAIEVRVQSDRFPAQRVGSFTTDHGRRVFETFLVEQGARLDVRCRDAGGRPVPGAEIGIEKALSLRLQGPDAQVWDEMPLRASASGARELLRVPPGEFVIRAEKEGYEGVEVKINLQPGEHREVVLVLERIP